MSGYKFHYFNSRGRAEICRLAFAAAKIEYEDIRLNSEEWAKEKESGRPPLGQMPFLVTPEGKVLGASGAIMKYICKQAGLCPTDAFEEAVADMIVDGVEDLFLALVKVFTEKDEVKKEPLLKEFFETTFPVKLEKFQCILKERNEGKGFFLGDKLTYADIIFFSLCNIFAEGEAKDPHKPLPDYPLLLELYNRVLNVPEIRAWVENRPKTDH